MPGNTSKQRINTCQLMKDGESYNYAMLLTKYRWHTIVISHPKSGRSWLRVMFNHLGIRAAYAHHGMGAPEQWQRIPLTFLYRDPRDTVVSVYFHRTRRFRDYHGTLAEMIRDGKLGLERICRFNANWLARGPQVAAGFFPLRYEELRQDTVGTLGRFIGHFHIAVSDDSIAKTVKKFTFEKMNAREAADVHGDAYSGTLSAANLADPDSFKVRRGKVGGYLDYLDANDLAYCAEVMTRHGFTP